MEDTFLASPSIKDPREHLEVSYWDETIGRYPPKQVSWSKYVDFWKAGLLKFQKEGTPKPDYYPSLEEAEMRVMHDSLTELESRTTTDRQRLQIAMHRAILEARARRRAQQPQTTLSESDISLDEAVQEQGKTKAHNHKRKGMQHKKTLRPPKSKLGR